MWPGFGDNLRVLEWIIKRCDDEVDATKTAIGYLPEASDINVNGLNIDEATMKELLTVDKAIWTEELNGIKEFFGSFGDKLPKELKDELNALEERLK
jgi:phosphoenolpyruvate carboxykinase (GTP)